MGLTAEQFMRRCGGAATAGASLPASPPKGAELIGERAYPPEGHLIPAYIRRQMGWPTRETVFRVRLNVDNQALAFQQAFLPSWNGAQHGYMPTVVELACRENERGKFRVTIKPLVIVLWRDSFDLGDELWRVLRRRFGSNRFDADLIITKADADA